MNQSVSKLAVPATSRRFDRQRGTERSGWQWLVLALPAILGAWEEQSIIQAARTGDSPMSIALSSTAFDEGDMIPKRYTGDGQNVSPPLEWSDPPPKAKGFALICEDPDAPSGTWVHWVLFDLPADTRKLKEGVPTEKTLADGARQGTNDFRKIGYGGPAPPRGKPHRYYFTIYATDAVIDLPAGATKDELNAAIKGHVLAEGRLMGRYER